MGMVRRWGVVVVCLFILLGVVTGSFADGGVVNLVDPDSSLVIVDAGDLFYVVAEHSAKSDKLLEVDLRNPARSQLWNAP